ncbi:MAG: response regulator [Planctomycetota bacterium]|nr:response regulator [Planctomycetota bacterium]
MNADNVINPQFFRAIEACPNSMIVTDQSGVIVFVNQKVEEAFGYTGLELIGQKVFFFLAETMSREDTSQSEQYFSAWIQKQSESKQVFQALHKSGETKSVEVNLNLVELSGTTIALLSILDISERIENEEVLKRAKDLAVEASKAKTEFLSNMSHEIRTPLNAIIGMTGLLLDSGLDDEQQECMRIIRNSGEALLSLINNILDFSKIEAGEMELENQPFCIRTCLEEAMDIVTTKITERGLELIYDGIGLSRNWVVGDLSRLRQIVVNLLNNAAKFTEQGEVILTAEIVPSSDDDLELLLTVQDTGIGLPKEATSRIFQSFQQVDASINRRFGGTGLGLPICERLTRLMGGKIWAESEGVGQGSRFCLQVPFAPYTPSEAELSEQSVDSASLTGVRITLLDENPASFQILKRKLKEWGASIVGIQSLEEALILFENGFNTELLIIDHHSTATEALESVALLRKLKTCKNLPIVLVSSMGQWTSENLGELKIESLITKPIKDSHLARTLTKLVGRENAEKPSAPTARWDAPLAQGKPLRILVAEDNPTNQMVTLKILERLQYRADVVANGLEVLEALERQIYDLVLMDIQMPVMDGLESARRVRELVPENEQPWIVAMTANVIGEVREKYLESGMNDYLGKPARPRDLVKVIERVPIVSRERRNSRKRRVPSVLLSHEGSAPPVNWRSLKMFHEGMGDQADDAVGQLVDGFLKNMDKIVGEMGEALEKNDSTELSRLAHSLKGSSSTMGAMILARSCSELETSKAEPLEQLRHMVETILKNAKAVEAIIPDWRNHIG